MPEQKKKGGTKKAKKRARPADPYEGKIYTTSKWKGMPNYECLFCAYATVNHEDALIHFEKSHVPDEEPTQIIDTGLVTEGGTKITRVAPAKED